MEAKLWEIYSHRCWVEETDPAVLHSATTALLTEAGFTILGELTHHFEPYGWTGIFLLAESHLALHTFPENNRTYLELASCSEDKYKNFVALLGEAKST